MSTPPPDAEPSEHHPLTTSGDGDIDLDRSTPDDGDGDLDRSTSDDIDIDLDRSTPDDIDIDLSTMDARAAEILAEPIVTIHTAEASIRRAPKIPVFIVLGAVIGAVFTVGLTLSFPIDPTVGLPATVGYFLLYGIPGGMVVGALVAIILDRVSARRARNVAVEQTVVDPLPYDDELPVAAPSTPPDADLADADLASTPPAAPPGADLASTPPAAPPAPPPAADLPGSSGATGSTSAPRT